VTQVLDVGSEKVLCLSEQELMRLLEDNVCRLLHSCPSQQVLVREFAQAYAKTCAGCLCLDDFGVATVSELVRKVPHLAKVCRHVQQLKCSILCKFEIVARSLYL